MKDPVEQLLTKSTSAKPKRPLRADFTQATISHISALPRHKARRPSLKGIFMKLLDKPAIAIASVVVAIAISGTAAYAAVVHWPSISAVFGGEQPTGDGRIVKVETTNCASEYSAFNITATDKNRGNTRYFKVKKDSKLTNEQITQMVLGRCEQGAQSDLSLAIQKEIDKNSANKNLVGGYIDNTITAITPTSISLEAWVPEGEKLVHFKKTFTKIASDVVVFYKDQKLTYGDLKVGDHVAFSYRATGNAWQHSETTPPTHLNPNEATIAVLIKNTPAITAAVDFQKYFGMEFDEVVPCDSQPSGYCTVAEYYQNK